jgi:hypothetical protein
VRALTQARTRTRPAADTVRARRPRIAAQEHLMSLTRREQHQLYRIESGLLQSDPKLAAMLTVFASLCAGQRLPAGEQLAPWGHIATWLDRIRQAAALIAEAFTAMAAAVGLLAHAVRTLLCALVGRRARRPQPARQQTGPGTDGQPNPADWN